MIAIEQHSSGYVMRQALRFITGGDPKILVSPRAFLVDSVKIRSRRYSPDGRRLFMSPDFGDAVRNHFIWRFDMRRNGFQTRDLVRVALLGAMGFALMYLEFPIPFLPVFLKYDFGDVPTLFAGFAMGPAAGFFSQIIKVLIFFLSGKGDAGLIGAAANLVAGGSLTLAASFVYRRMKSKSNMIFSLIVGVIAMVVVTTLANIYVFLPLYGIPTEQIMPFIYAGSIPFNLIKGMLTSLMTYLLYGRFRRILRA